jgi:hypothetical protein
MNPTPIGGDDTTAKLEPTTEFDGGRCSLVATL